MSSAGIRDRILPVRVLIPGWTQTLGSPVPKPGGMQTLATGTQHTESESHRRNRSTGNYDGGGPFYTSRIAYSYKPGYVRNAWISELSRRYFYTGPFYANLALSPEECSKLSLPNPLKYGAFDKSSMSKDGTTAISLCNPVNPASNLGTTLAETRREGLPNLPGVQLWKSKTRAAQAAGSEYLNAVFGWLPLVDEVSAVRDAARQHRDLMNQYHRGEGQNTRRRFDFPSTQSVSTFNTTGYPFGTEAWRENAAGPPTRSLTKTTVRKRWFEGCFTYGLPSSTDSWGKALGFGSQADQLFGIALTPDVLWELTPWSWAIDWFSNAGDVINNVTNFGLAGLVMRYGYMMEETIETILVEHGVFYYRTSDSNGNIIKSHVPTPICSGEISIITKRRIPASPFGFGIGWEGLSPTQLAITAALGITKFL